MDDLKCSFPDCPETCKGHKWAKIRAAAAGWFFSKSGKALCPKHAFKKAE